MPHIVFGEKIDLLQVYEIFQPIIQKSENIIRIKEIYLNPSKNNALISAITIEKTNQDFFIELLASDSKTTIRLLPLTDPEKTDSVKKAMVLVAQLILKEFPQLEITKTNLQDYLLEKSIRC
ncbi:MAG: hypothetical protein P8X83_04910 [Nitrosopumilaceae archaeon]|jgi:hypothetical protein